MRRRRRRLRLLLVLCASAATLLVALGLYATGALRSQELGTVDARFSVRGKEKPPADLAVVAIDANAFRVVRRTWPFPRRYHAQVIDRLREAGARSIAYDIQFTEQTNDFDDNALIDAVARAPRVVLATTEITKAGDVNIFGGGNVLRDIGARAGVSLLPNDPAGYLRRVAYGVDGVPSFAVATAERSGGRDIAPSALGGDTAWIDFAGPPGTIPTYSFGDVLEGRFPKLAFEGKTVVIGPSAPTLQDNHPTPFASEDLMPGAEIQANAIATALEGFPLQQVPGWVDVALVALLALMGPPIVLRFGVWRGGLLCLLAAALYTVGVQIAFDRGWIVAFVYPLAGLVLGTVSGLLLLLVVDVVERERMRDLFSRFVPEAVVDEVLAAADEDLRLGGVRRVVTVMFTDLRGFTTFSESRPPDQVVDVLNRYLTAMSDIIRRHGGTLVSYLGDGILAVFGAPLDQPDHADRAVAAAREMTGDALAEFNAWMRSQGAGEGFRMGIGINSGQVMAGNVGSEQRLEYTVIGDVPNTASRMEGMTKGTPWMVFVADSTRELLIRDVGDLVHVDDLAVRGRETGVRVWSIGEPVYGIPGGRPSAADRPDTGHGPGDPTPGPGGPRPGVAAPR